MEKVSCCCCVVIFFLCCARVALSVTDPNDLKILNDFKEGLENPDLLKWNGDDPCGSPPWPYVYCSGNRVTQIQVKNLGLKGPLPQNLNQLSKLSNVGLQRNNFTGKLPSFSGLSELQYAYLDSNQFDTIPSDFFDGLTSVTALALDHNPFNASTGWSLPGSLAHSVQLVNLSCVGCNLIGPLPDFLGSLYSLSALRLSYNRLSGEIPANFNQSLVQILWLNNQDGGGLSGSIDVIAEMKALSEVWLHGNQFTGKIPENIGDLIFLKELKLNGNRLVGLIPDSLANMELQTLALDSNALMGPIPKFKAGNVSYAFNSFCQSTPGMQCADEVNVLLDFLDGMNYPSSLVSKWSGNDPCQEPEGWLGVNCNANKVSVINLPRRNFTGTIRPSLAELDSLKSILLQENNISGTIPMNFTEMPALSELNLGSNNIAPPLPKFRDDVKLIIEGNPLLLPTSNHTPASPYPLSSSPPMPHSQASPTTSSDLEPPPAIQAPHQGKIFEKKIIVMVAAVGFLVGIVLVVALLCICCVKKRRHTKMSPNPIVVHPRDQSHPADDIKITIAKLFNKNLFVQTASSSGSCKSGATEGSHVVDAENLVINVQVLRKVTDNFSKENELGRGGFGSVYKGELEDGTKIAVKRMLTGVMNNKFLDEFQAEIAVLSKVRHRHLVSLLGYSVEGNERLLIYEYMPQGALSSHLFHWKSLNLKPLSWTSRLVIALDVAKGMEYLHNLARQTFIHRDLKSSNILLDDEFHAKVSDFGLVKLAPDGEKSVATRLAGTFGYLAPEYAVMGKITTKADVFSYGVVLMELLTGLVALDEGRSEERRYLAEWFSRIRSNKEKLRAAIDPALDVNEEDLESISTIAELAGHCSAREPYNRPDMGYVVNVLAPLVVNWKPVNDESEYCLGIDYSKPLPQMLRIWQEAESRDASYNNSENSQGSLPARPAGFADSFTSVDAR